MSGFSVCIPPPPSLNNAFVNVRSGGRRKSDRYRKWTSLAVGLIKVEVPAVQRCGGEIMVDIDFPSKSKADIDNLIKGILDALVASTRVDDDRNVCELRVTRKREGDDARVFVRPA